jgi:serine protease Do
MKDGSISRGWLGVQIQPVSEDIAESLALSAAKGAMVNEVQDASPAKKAGIEVGDIVLKVNGQLVEDPKDLARKVAEIKPGTPADVIIWRDGAEKTVSVSIEKLTDVAAATPEAATPAPSEPQDLAAFGLKVAPNDKGAGVVVTDVDPESAAAERGLTAGDIIAAVNDMDVKSASDVSKAVDAASAKGRKSVLLRVDGENGSRFVALPVGKG